MKMPYRYGPSRRTPGLHFGGTNSNSVSHQVLIYIFQFGKSHAKKNRGPEKIASLFWWMENVD